MNPSLTFPPSHPSNYPSFPPTLSETYPPPFTYYTLPTHISTPLDTTTISSGLLQPCSLSCVTYSKIFQPEGLNALNILLQIIPILPPTYACIIPLKLHQKTANDLPTLIKSNPTKIIILQLIPSPSPEILLIPDTTPASFLQSHSIPSVHLYLPPSPPTTPPLFPPHTSPPTLPPGVYRGTYRCSIQYLTSFTSNLIQDKGFVNVRRNGEYMRVTVEGWREGNRAVDGDLVLIEVTGKEETKINEVEKQPEKDGVKIDVTSGVTEEESSFKGKIISIVTRRSFGIEICGSIHTPSEDDIYANQVAELAEDGVVVFYPVDERYPPILIPSNKELENKRLNVILTSWPDNSRLPLGRFIRVLGDTGDRDVETEVLLHQHDIPTKEFSEEVLRCLPEEGYEIKMDKNRLDLRDLPILSIDPPGCKDIDDALHSKVLPNGNWSVGVHIADVTHYVEAGSALDLEASDRCTSTYLVTRRLDMLPGMLTTDLCSLKPNLDRYAFSVIWEMTPEGEVVDVEFRKSIIHSIAGLTYQQAQELIDSDDKSVKGEAVKRLNKLAKIFREKRIKAGALTLASPEVKFKLDDESLNPTDVQEYTLYEANALVEEFMLLANVTVGKRILRQYPSLGVLRRHPSPDVKMFDGLIKKAASRGFTIDPSDSKKLADSLDKAVDPSDPYFNKLLRILSTRCMSPAQYFCSGSKSPTEWHHFGLASPIYTHFTSPIRRYADVLVHRLLAASIGYGPLPVHLASRSMIDELCEQMNRRHRNAQLAGRASVNLFTLRVRIRVRKERGGKSLVMEYLGGVGEKRKGGGGGKGGKEKKKAKK
ncbi:hypothetical protein TrLO_g12227 [Triparma laevis f. longispina]|uniref:RNB domain-containing protein n=1 Tax=Triparma laevis f. longispina TaxID=1714387 RepID=A0A9W7FM45_9STRA|nr:hypothetical protein TrLO_g12227 [Triparma laevis f. longispina]